MVDGVGDPLYKDLELEEVVLLAHYVELRIPIKQSCRDKLIQDTEGQGWQDGVKDVVERQSPGFVNDLAGKDVLERVLHRSVSDRVLHGIWLLYLTQNCVIYRAMFL